MASSAVQSSSHDHRVVSARASSAEFIAECSSCRSGTRTSKDSGRLRDAQRSAMPKKFPGAGIDTAKRDDDQDGSAGVSPHPWFPVWIPADEFRHSSRESGDQGPLSTLGYCAAWKIRAPAYAPRSSSRGVSPRATSE
jgi:hypothetical protein